MTGIGINDMRRDELNEKFVAGYTADNFRGITKTDENTNMHKALI